MPGPDGRPQLGGKPKFEPGVNPSLSKTAGQDLGLHSVQLPMRVFAGNGNVTMSMKIGEADAQDGHRVRIMHDLGWNTVKCRITDKAGKCVAAVELDAHALFEVMTEAGLQALAEQDAGRRGDEQAMEGGGS